MTAAASPARVRRLRPAAWGVGLERWRPVAVQAALVSAVLIPAVAEGGLWVRHPLTTVVNLLVSAGAIGAGALLAGDAEQRVTGYVLIASGVTRPLEWADEWVAGPGPLYAQVFEYLPITLTAWALLRYPAASLSRRRRRFLVVLVSWLIGLPALEACVARPVWLGEPDTTSATWWPYLWQNRRAFEVVDTTLIAGCAVLAVAFLTLMLRGPRVGERRERAVRLPVAAAGMLAAVASGAVLLITAFTGQHDEVFAIGGMADLGVPIAFLVSFGQRRLTRLSSLVTVFDNAHPTTHLLRELLRLNLCDPGLDLLVWSEGDHGYLTVDGAPADVVASSRERRVIPVIGRGGRPLALLVVDAHTAGDDDLAGAAVAISKLALENLLLSRRLLTAEYDARQLIVADLHDCGREDPVRVIVADDVPMLRDLYRQSIQAERLRAGRPRLGIVMFSVHMTTAYLRRITAIGDGTHIGYLGKERVKDARTIVDALARVTAGDTVIDDALAEQMLRTRRVQDPIALLTGRQREALELLAQGRTNKAIAEHMKVAVPTVEAYLSEVFKTLDIPASPDDHKRVLAVLAWLRSVGARPGTRTVRTGEA